MDEEAQFSIVYRRCHQHDGNQLPYFHLLLHIWPASKLAILQSLTHTYWRLQGVSIGLNGTFLHAASMHSRAFYIGKKFTCLRIFRFLMAQRATGQCRTLVQIQRGRLKLPARRWKHKWCVASCSWYAKLGSLHTEKIYQLANLLFVCSAEGDGAISPSFSTINGSIDVSSSSLEAPIATHHIRGGGGGARTRERFHDGKQIPICRSFILYSWRGRQSNVYPFCS